MSESRDGSERGQAFPYHGGRLIDDVSPTKRLSDLGTWEIVVRYDGSHATALTLSRLILALRPSVLSCWIRTRYDIEPKP